MVLTRDRAAPPALRAEGAGHAYGETHGAHRSAGQDEDRCFTLFRRAIVDCDESCRQKLHAIYREQMLAWCARFDPHLAVTPRELVAQGWQTFWLSYTPARLATADSTTAVLRYLQMCAYCAAIDAGRARQVGDVCSRGRSAHTERKPVGTEIQMSEADRRKIQGLVDAQLHTEQERTLVHLAFELGLSPSEVAYARPDLFPTVSDVLRIMRSILDRLRASDTGVE